MDTPSVLPLRCEVQDYPWGKIGNSSMVAQLAASSNPDFVVDSASPYAELWMGTHAKAPSRVELDVKVEPLHELLARQPQLCGKFSHAAGQLPFLFKVLSVNKTLSIQAHPDKALAEKLHAADPEHYRDDNHKPEMAIALTPFEGMCGFRLPSEIRAFLKSVPELRAAVGEDAAAAFEAAEEAQTKPALKALFKALMEAEAGHVAAQVKQLAAHVAARGKEADPSKVESFFLRLSTQYPGDVGCFCLYLLNIVQLAPGEAMFLGPNLPHAYIAGDCIECMACSDNVVRAGCTGKFKDVKNLVEMLTYATGTDKEQLLQPTGAAEPSKSMLVYDPPVPEFTVASITLEAGGDIDLPPVAGPSIALLVAGDCSLFYSNVGKGKLGALSSKHDRGATLFIAANSAVRVKAGAIGAKIYRAYVH